MEECCRLALDPQEKPFGRCGSAWRRIKVVLAVLLLVPLRIFIILLALFMSWLVCILSQLVGGECGSREEVIPLTPHSWPQRRLLTINMIAGRLLMLGFGFIWVRTKGSPYLARPCTFVANHTTCLDAWYFFYALSGHLTIVLVSWVKKMPIMGTIVKAHHVLPVKLTEPPCAETNAKAWQPPEATDLEQAKLRPQSKYAVLDSGNANVICRYQKEMAVNPKLFSLVVFPEGTTKTEHCLLKFRTGAFVSGEPVQPVVMHYQYKHVSISFVGGLGEHLGRLVTMWYNPLHVTWLPVYNPTEEEKGDPSLYASNVQAVMAKEMGLPADRIFQDCGNREIYKFLSADKK